MPGRRLLLGAATALTLAAQSGPSLAFQKASLAERANASAPTEFEVMLPPGPSPDLDALVLAQVTPGSAHYHRWLTPTEYRTRFGTDPVVMDAAARELESLGLRVIARHAHGLRVQGVVSSVERALGSHLRVAHFADGHTALAAESGMTLPPMLAAHQAVVAAFSPVIRMRTHSVVRATSGVSPDNRESPGGDYWFDDLKQAYKFPAYQAANGTGTTIGILVSGAYNSPDIKAYFAHEKLTTPALSEINIEGGQPFSFDNSGETHLDIQQAGGMAPKARIVHYNLPDLSEAHIQEGLIEIVESNAVDIVNMSFGAPEIAYDPSYNGGVSFFDILRAQDLLFRQGNAEGITFVASSGDAGARPLPVLDCLYEDSMEGCGGFNLSAEFPASSPHVTGVGGTDLTTVNDSIHRNNLDSNYQFEIAWSDPLDYDIFYGSPASGARWGSGGGVSLIFSQPTWQKPALTGYDKRTVPDVAGHMGGCVGDSILPCGKHRSGDVLVIAGQTYSVYGTSASAPDFAGLVALRVQREGSRLGLVNRTLYAMAAAQSSGRGPTVFRENIPGNNGYYPTKTGYNLVLGLGTIYGAAFVGLPHGPFAGNPQTSSNP